MPRMSTIRKDFIVVCKSCLSPTPPHQLIASTCITCLGWTEDEGRGLRPGYCEGCSNYLPLNDNGVCSSCFAERTSISIDKANMEIVLDYCPKCGGLNESKDAICDECYERCDACGDSFKPANLRDVLCPKCESYADDDSCPYCIAQGSRGRIGRNTNACEKHVQEVQSLCPVCKSSPVYAPGVICEPCTGFDECMCGEAKPTYKYLCQKCEMQAETVRNNLR